jgi:hypothetical protein
MMFEEGDFFELRGRANSSTLPTYLPIGVLLVKLVEINVVNRRDGASPLAKTVTTDRFCNYEPLNRVLNTQMIIDWPVTPGDGAKTYLTISKTVLQRMIDGKTRGIAIKALGAIDASFYSMENDQGKHGARLHFNIQN